MRRTFVLFFFFVASTVSATEGTAGPPKIIDGIACAADPSITYAYYLPSRYTTAQRWPVLFVFDPRKRGVVAAELFRDAAERYGWIIVSSNNTESDADGQPSVHAIQTTLPDAQKRFSIDSNRIYLAGFSGTAIIAWAVGEVTKSVAGLIGCSGRPLPSPSYRVPFAWFGTVGDRDFNYLETMQIDRGMAAAGGTHRLEVFEGTHSWAPPELLQRGIEWMELLAMKAGPRTRDDSFVKTMFDGDLARAKAEREPLAAVRQLQSIVSTFDGLIAVDEPRRLVAEMRASPAYARAEKEEKRAEESEQASRASAGRVIQQFINTLEPPMAGSLAHDLRITELERLAEKRSYEGLAAARALEGIRAQTGFYAAREVTGAKAGVLKVVTAMIR